MPEKPQNDITELVSREFESGWRSRIAGWQTLLWLVIGALGLIFTLLLLFVLFIALRTALLYGLAGVAN